MARRKFMSERDARRSAASDNERWLASLGVSHDQRVNAINAIYDAKNATITCTRYRELSSTVTKGQKQAKGYMFFRVTRSLATLDNREREYLRIVELINSAKRGEWDDPLGWKSALLWGEGKGTIAPDFQKEWNGKLIGTPDDEFMELMRKFQTVERTINNIQLALDRISTMPNLDPGYRQLILELKDGVAPSSGGSWLKPTQLAGTAFAEQSGYHVYIGTFPDGTPLSYSGEGSMITIAPPGSGKTQCHVFPNLLVWPGPAIVLDVSGDIFEKTAAWRASNIGPVYKFSPLEPESSNRYNPLTFVRSHPDYIWEDARLLSEMMIVPSNSSDPFWENEARTVLTAAIAHVCYANPPEARPMHAVLDVLFGGQPWDDMILGLRMAIDVRVMTQHATALSSMNEKTLSSVLQTARSSLGAWSGERVARVTAASDWSPLDLRQPSNPTIYITVRPNEVEAYLSLIRVFIGQHIRMLTGGDVPPHGSPPVLLMLDELPRLRSMAPVDEALNIGRKYGLRLWMFAQSIGQMANAYPNADGMMGSCAVRIFMNPSGADGVAEKLSEELGYVDSLHDNSRKRLIEASELAGPTFQNRQLVLGVGTGPMVVDKAPAWRNPEFQRRMEIGREAPSQPIRTP